jgi:hypothetical protein
MLTVPNKNEIKKFFEKKLSRSGHSLEILVTKMLNQYNVQQEVPYLDKDTSIGRFTDLIATKQVPPIEIFGGKSVDGKRVVAQVILVIECKNLPDHGWIFWQGKVPELVFVDNATLADNLSPDLFKGNPGYKYIPFTVIPELIPVSSYEEYILDTGTRKDSKSNQMTNNILDAIMKVTKATEYQIQEMRDVMSQNMVSFAGTLENFILYVVVQPVIVFEGYLYGAKTEEQYSLQEIKFAQLPKRYVSQHYNVSKGMVHIVSYKSFSEYLNLLDSYYIARSTKMAQDQEQLMDKVFLMFDYLAKRVNLHLGSCAGRFQKLLEYTQGKLLETKLSEVRGPTIFLRKVAEKVEPTIEQKSAYDREIHYCFNCGTAVTTILEPGKLVCCPIFKQALFYYCN